MEIPKPTGVGYFAKVTHKRPEWLKAAGVEEVCSVSECVSSGPKDWIQKWLHNDLGFFDSETLALQVVTDERNAFDLYAYKVYPLEFGDDLPQSWQVPVSAVDLDLEGFDFLGFDVVSRSAGSNCECSPLSCNSAADDFPVNRFCLIADVATAYNAAVEISKGTYEPGPYYLFEVYRRRRGG